MPRLVNCIVCATLHKFHGSLCDDLVTDPLVIHVSRCKLQPSHMYLSQLHLSSVFAASRSRNCLITVTQI